MAKFCSECGAPLEQDAKFCGNCGAKMDSAEQPQQRSIPNDSMAHIKQEFDVVKKNVAGQINNVSHTDWQRQMEANSFIQRFKAKYLTTQGRLNRWAYFVTGLKLFFMSLIPYILLGIGVAMLDAKSGFANLLGVILILPSVVLVFAFAVAGFMLGVRRCHDLGHSGWVMLLGFIPYVNIIFYIYVVFWPGTKGPNQYGDDPLQEASYR